MYPGYWDDYMNDGTPDPDVVTNVYQITKDNKEFSSMKAALKDAALYWKAEHNLWNSEMKRTSLKEHGYTIQVREYNVTRKKWETEDFIPV